MKTKQTIYVRDDLGHAWYFADGAIRLLLAELEMEEEGLAEENGYPCESLEEGVGLLNEYGYITGIEYDENEADEYFDLKKHAEDW